MPEQELFGRISDIDKWVYHYTSMETALEHILPTGKIRMGSFATLNDPRESKDWSFQIMMESFATPIGNKEFFSIQTEATKFLKKNCKVLSMSSDIAQENHISHFQRGYAYPRMWAQYGQNHKGVCLIFNREKVLSCIEKESHASRQMYADRVIYNENPLKHYEAFHINYNEVVSTSLQEVLEIKLKKFYKTYFFTKTRDWRTENEWRCILLGDDSNPEFFSIDDSLVGMVLGADLPSSYLPSIKKLSAEYNIPVSKIDWRNGSPTPLPAFD